MNCVNCNSFNTKEVVYEGHFLYKGKEYPLKTKYTVCENCLVEFITPEQIKENQNYLDSVRT